MLQGVIVMVIADQSESLQSALRISGELDKLPFQYQFANFVGGPAILEAFRAGAADVAPVPWAVEVLAGVLCVFSVMSAP